MLGTLGSVSGPARVSEPLGNPESVVRGRPHVHRVPVAQPAAVPAAPGVHLAGGGQGQVVVAVGVGSDLHDVSGGKTLDQLRGLRTSTGSVTRERARQGAAHSLRSTAHPTNPTPTTRKDRPPSANGGLPALRAGPGCPSSGHSVEAESTSLDRNSLAPTCHRPPAQRPPGSCLAQSQDLPREAGYEWEPRSGVSP